MYYLYYLLGVLGRCFLFLPPLLCEEEDNQSCLRACNRSFVPDLVFFFFSRRCLGLAAGIIAGLRCSRRLVSGDSLCLRRRASNFHFKREMAYRLILTTLEVDLVF